MADSFFQKAYDEEFSKIPSFFRFTRRKAIFFWVLLAIWIIVDISLVFYVKDEPMDTVQLVPEHGFHWRANFDSWQIYTFANTILALIMSWGVLGLVFDRRAFRRASKLTAMHSEWERYQTRKEATAINREVEETRRKELEKKLEEKPRFCPLCGLLLPPHENICPTCGEEYFEIESDSN